MIDDYLERDARAKQIATRSDNERLTHKGLHNTIFQKKEKEIYMRRGFGQLLSNRLLNSNKLMLK